MSSMGKYWLGWNRNCGVNLPHPPGPVKVRIEMSLDIKTLGKEHEEIHHGLSFFLSGWEGNWGDMRVLKSHRRVWKQKLCHCQGEGTTKTEGHEFIVAPVTTIKKPAAFSIPVCTYLYSGAHYIWRIYTQKCCFWGLKKHMHLKLERHIWN